MPAQFIVAFANRKGGVGKTTSAVNVAGVVAAAGKRVLLVDLDQQDSCGELLGLPESDGRALLEALTAGAAPVVVRDVRPGFDLIASGVDLGELPERMWREADPWGVVTSNLARAIDQAGDYDLVVIDTPPGDILLTRAAMAVARHLVIPVKASRMSLSALRRTAAIFAPDADGLRHAWRDCGIVPRRHKRRLSCAVHRGFKKNAEDRSCPAWRHVALPGDQFQAAVG